MKGGIAGRLAIIFSLLVLVATSTVGFLVFWGAREALISSSTERLGHTAETVEVRFLAGLEAIRKDALFLAATPPVPGLIRAQDGSWVSRREGRLDTETNHSEQEWRDQLAGIFAAFLENRASYRQVRFIGLAENGRELVRVVRDGDATRRVLFDELRRQGEGRYLTEVVNRAAGQVYFSSIEHATDSTGASVPMLRAATPIFDARGEAFGALVIDVDVRPLLHALHNLVDPEMALYLANSRGDVLVHPDSARLAEAPEALHLQDEFPESVAWFEAAEAGTPPPQPLVETEAPVLSYVEGIPFSGAADAEHLVLGVTAPRDRILAGVTKLQSRSALTTVLFALWGIILALVFSGYLTRPLRQVTRAIAQFGRDDVSAEEKALPVDRKDEIGVLAGTFDTMAQQIQAQIRELEDEARRQRIILETSAEGIIVTDERGHIETFNRAAERMFGYRAEEVLGRNVNRLVFTTEPAAGRPAPSPAAEAERWQLDQGQEVTGRRKDGTTFPLSLALSSFDFGGEKKYAGFLQDITGRRQYEQKLREAKLSAEAANTAKSAFLANMSHEIRTPLTGIIGFASLLAKQVTGRQRKFARLIERSAERLKETLNSVLDLAKLEANKIEIELDALQVHEEVKAAVEIFQAQAEQKGLTLLLEVAPEAEDARARLDRGALASILHNLVGNAIKFTEAGGVIVRVEADADTVEVQVEDTGVGIDPSFMPYLFDVFRQESTGLSRTHEGSGLGLSITQRLVRLLDGEIAVQSEKGVGSTFRVAFPRVPAETDALRFEEVEIAPPETNGRPPEGRARLLLVEDNEHTQFLIESLLEDDFDVTVVSNAEEALLEAFRVDFDMVLMDINLGDGPNGADVLRELRAMPSYRDVPIAAITAYALPGDRERFLDMGFSAYLSKPFNADELLSLTARL